jgi:DNA-3-methyladenine glycosylase
MMKKKSFKLPLAWYQDEDTLRLSRELLGKYLFTKLHGEGVTGGIITETEAYMGPADKASHAYNNRRTKRTEVMFHPGGICYVYLCYGLHHLFNIVTHGADTPHAILVRAIMPTTGIEIMLKRTKRQKATPGWTSGPALLTKALGITTKQSGLSLVGDEIWLEDRGIAVDPSEIIIGPRVGIDYAEEFVGHPWRFQLSNHLKHIK